MRSFIPPLACLGETSTCIFPGTSRGSELKMWTGNSWPVDEQGEPVREHYFMERWVRMEQE